MPSPPRLALAALVATLALAAPAGAAPTAWSTDGPVLAMARVGSTLYIGGDFGRVGADTGPAVLVSETDGQPTGHWPFVAGTAGRLVRAAVPDGAGGVYIGGDFLSVDGAARTDVAHILPDGTVDPGFAVSTDDGSSLYALALAGDTLYLGGTFTTVDGASRSHLAAVDAATGALRDWNPGADSTVQALLVDGATVYVGGGFGTLGGATRSRLGAVSATTGAATAFDPAISNTAPFASAVTALAKSGSTLYVGGNYDSAGGATRHHLSSFDTGTGLVTSWDPNLNSIVRSFALGNGLLYVAGNYDRVAAGTVTRQRLAAWSVATGALSAWDPAASGGSAHDVLVDGDRVLVVGEFDQVGGQPRGGAAEVDAGTGALRSGWNPNGDGPIYRVARAGDRILLGGMISSVGGVDRANLAAIDLATGQPTAWNPGADSTVTALAATADRVYAGGSFLHAGGQARQALAALDRATGAALAWDPGADEQVYALAADDTTVWAGGLFQSAGGQARRFLAAIDATTGLATSWDPTAQSTVRALVLAGTTLYVGGDFGATGGDSRDRVAAYDVTSGTLLPWNPGATGRSVYALAATAGAVYVGGDFTAIGGAVRNRLAALSRTTGQATAWDPGIGGDLVSALATDGDVVYAGGLLTTAGAASRRNAVALDAVSAVATSWDPSPANRVFALVATDAVVGLGGSFSSGTGFSSHRIALVEPSRIAPRGSTPVITGAAVLGRTLTAVAGTWGGRPAPSVALQWLRCDGAGAACTAIAGATTGSYVLRADDIDRTLVLRATGANAEGSAERSSAPTAVVVPEAATVLRATGGGVLAIARTATSLPVRCALDRPGIRTCTATLAVRRGSRLVTVAASTGTATGVATAIDLALPVDAALQRLTGLADGRRATLTVTAAQAGRSATLTAAPAVVLTRAGTVNALTDGLFRGRKGTRLTADALLRDLRAAVVGARSVTCTGHTDSRGPAAANRKLGLARAKAACAFLKGATGLRTTARTKGEAAPRATNRTQAGRARNRYVGIAVTR